jgi:peptide-methionine (S)-S-oxide reductase
MTRRILGSLLLATLFASPAVADPKLETAVFAGGCFWSMEHDLKPVPGITQITVGYTGGHLDHPTYQDVVTEKTGHREAVKVTYDPSRISYAQLVERYWHVIDPTDAGGAYCDRGESYRSAIFVSSPEQKRIAEASKARLAKLTTIATEVRDAATFWPAEEYHQDFATKKPDHYNRYRKGCGKDARLASLWGNLAFH